MSSPKWLEWQRRKYRREKVAMNEHTMINNLIADMQKKGLVCFSKGGLTRAGQALLDAYHITYYTRLMETHYDWWQLKLYNEFEKQGRRN